MLLLSRLVPIRFLVKMQIGKSEKIPVCKRSPSRRLSLRIWLFVFLHCIYLLTEQFFRFKGKFSVFALVSTGSANYHSLLNTTPNVLTLLQLSAMCLEAFSCYLSNLSPSICRTLPRVLLYSHSKSIYSHKNTWYCPIMAVKLAILKSKVPDA